MNPLAPPHTILASGWSGGGHGRGWFWPVIPLVWIALVGLAVWFGTRCRPTQPNAVDRAKDVLADRYARGELSSDEYRERLGNLG